jgi:hypothetical protein
MAGVMLVVVSMRNTMSGFGGMAGVDTVFATVVVPPGGRLRVTDDGSTPGSATASAAIAIVDVSSAAVHAAAMLHLALRLSLLMIDPPFPSEWDHSQKNLDEQG